MNNDIGFALIICCLILTTCGVEVTVVNKPHRDIFNVNYNTVVQEAPKSVSEALGLKPVVMDTN